MVVIFWEDRIMKTTLIELLATTVVFLIILMIIIGLITKDNKNIDCYMTSRGLICNYGKVGE